jgi:hypothetical protein
VKASTLVSSSVISATLREVRTTRTERFAGTAGYLNGMRLDQIGGTGFGLAIAGAVDALLRQWRQMGREQVFTAGQAVAAGLLANGMGNTDTASARRPRLQSSGNSAHC